MAELQQLTVYTLTYRVRFNWNEPTEDSIRPCLSRPHTERFTATNGNHALRLAKQLEDWRAADGDDDYGDYTVPEIILEECKKGEFVYVAKP